MGPVALCLFPGTVGRIGPVQTILVVEFDVRPFVGAVVSPFAVAGGIRSGTGPTRE